jgi:hypothetical protein
MAYLHSVGKLTAHYITLKMSKLRGAAELLHIDWMDDGIEVESDSMGEPAYLVGLRIDKYGTCHIKTLGGTIHGSRMFVPVTTKGIYTADLIKVMAKLEEAVEKMAKSIEKEESNGDTQGK